MSLPIESLRCGAAPSAWLPEPGPDVIWSPYDIDGDAKVSNIGGGLIFAPELVNIRVCSRCRAELVSPQFLALHQEREHGRGDG
jgi:hypothetical protein